mmetsp:Transcript_2933/g.5406  ORF Transcript_2933/g.5406 Transcript_2933/m.5406 type:complete len:113 (-) Transcript_2933:1413-1751(-)
MASRSGRKADHLYLPRNVSFLRVLSSAPHLTSASLLSLPLALFFTFTMNPTLPLRMACGKGKTTPTKRLSSAGTGFFYTTRKNVVRTPDKIALVKYDPVIRRRVLFNEHKIK